MQDFEITCTPGRESTERGKSYAIHLKNTESSQQWRGVFIDSTNYFPSAEDVVEFVKKYGKVDGNDRDCELILPISNIRLRCSDALQKQPSFAVVRLDVRHHPSRGAPSSAAQNLFGSSRVVFSVGTMISNTGGFVPLLYNYTPRKFVVSKIAVPEHFDVKIQVLKNPTPDSSVNQSPRSVVLNQEFEIGPYEEVACECESDKPGLGFLMIRATK
jgi:hypothetical protein